MFWVGDFNYRLNVPLDVSIERILQLIEIHQKDGVFTEIYQYDQVCTEAWSHLLEVPISELNVVGLHTYIIELSADYFKRLNKPS